MSKYLTFLVCSLLLISCVSEKEKQQLADKEPLMYEPSEMALLMRQMYEYNNLVKTQIVKKDSLLAFPDEFLGIHTAVLTDPSERDVEFDSLAKLFIEQQKATFSSQADSAQYHFNNSVNTCIECHKTRCVGPLPKIKKLLIK